MFDLKLQICSGMTDRLWNILSVTQNFVCLYVILSIKKKYHEENAENCIQLNLAV